MYKRQTQNTHTREFNTWYHTVRLHSKLPRQRTVATASTAKPRGAATTAADFTAVPPLLPIDIDNQQHCYLLLAEALAVKKLNNNSITRSSMERQAASPNVVPNLICVPQLFASSTPSTQLEIIIISGIQIAANSNRRAAAAAVLGLKCPWISYDG